MLLVEAKVGRQVLGLLQFFLALHCLAIEQAVATAKQIQKLVLLLSLLLAFVYLADPSIYQFQKFLQSVLLGAKKEKIEFSQVLEVVGEKLD